MYICSWEKQMRQLWQDVQQDNMWSSSIFITLFLSLSTFLAFLYLSFSPESATGSKPDPPLGTASPLFEVSALLLLDSVGRGGGGATAEGAGVVEVLLSEANVSWDDRVESLIQPKADEQQRPGVLKIWVGSGPMKTLTASYSSSPCVCEWVCVCVSQKRAVVRKACSSKNQIHLCQKKSFHSVLFCARYIDIDAHCICSLGEFFFFFCSYVLDV